MNLDLFFLLLGGHFLMDYPLQGDFLARAKSHRRPVPGVPWYQALGAHAVLQGAAVYVVTASWTLAFMEVVLHAAIDYARDEELLTFNQDQTLHWLCKALYAIQM